jgi:hypothetical protein
MQVEFLSGVISGPTIFSQTLHGGNPARKKVISGKVKINMTVARDLGIVWLV